MEILLDPEIRDWVFIPIIFVMFLIANIKSILQKNSQGQKEVPVKDEKGINDIKDKYTNKQFTCKIKEII